MLPLESWPDVGIVKVPLLTPVCGMPGCTWPSCRKSMFQVKALAGRVPSSGPVASPLNEITAPARNVLPSWGERIVAIGLSPALTDSGVDRLVLTPSENDSLTEIGRA